MGNIARKERMLGSLLPVSFLFFAFMAMNIEPLFFPFVLQLSAFLLFAAAYSWDFKGLFFSSALSCIVFLGICPRVFLELPSFLFFLIAVNTAFIVALLKKIEQSAEKNKEEELERLKVWETHYYAFRLQCLEELEAVRKAESELLFIDQQLQSLEKERIEECLEEDTSQKTLIDLFIASQKKCLDLQQEIELLEQIVLEASKVSVKPKKARKKKIKEELGQGTFF